MAKVNIETINLGFQDENCDEKIKFGSNQAKPEIQSKRNGSSNAKKLLILFIVTMAAIIFNLLFFKVFSFNFETYNQYERSVPYFHPRYLEAFLSWAFNLHLNIRPYISGQRLTYDGQYSDELLAIVTMIASSCALAASGASFQAVFNNPLASADVLGVTAGTELGGILAFAVLSFGYYGSFTFGFLLGLFTIGVVFLLGHIIDRGSPKVITLLLTGIVLTQLYNSCITTIMSGVLKFATGSEDTSSMYDRIQAFTQSHFDGRVNMLLFITVPVGVIILMLLSWRMNALAFGDEEARGMGVSPKMIRIVTILVSTLLTSVAVSQCGPIGFVGLVAPHVARRIVGQNYRWIIPASMLIGCLFVTFACFAGNFVGDDDINSITCIIGVPYFIKILLNNRRKKSISPT